MKVIALEGGSTDSAAEVISDLREVSAEMRDNDETPMIYAMIGSDKRLPAVVRCKVSIQDLAVFQKLIELDVSGAMMDVYEREND